MPKTRWPTNGPREAKGPGTVTEELLIPAARLAASPRFIAASQPSFQEHIAVSGIGKAFRLARVPVVMFFVHAGQA